MTVLLWMKRLKVRRGEISKDLEWNMIYFKLLKVQYLCNIRYTQYTIDQQPLDTDVVNEVFRKHFAELTKLMSIATNRLAVAVELYSEKLITEGFFDEAVDDGPRTDMAKGVSLSKAVKATINSQPQLITKLISILQNIEAFNSLAVKMSCDLFLK